MPAAIAPTAAGAATFALGQEGSRAHLDVRGASTGTDVCLELRGHGQLCATARGGLVRRTAGASAQPVPVHAGRRGGALRLTFLPAAARLPVGPVQWRGSPHGRWQRSVLRLVGGPPCFGAAARAGCRGARVRGVTPPVRASQPTLAPLCWWHTHEGPLRVCAFGAPERAARGRFALVGDSHAAHWRPAVEVLTHARRWHGHSILRAGCVPTLGTTLLPEPGRSAGCRRWNRAVLGWLAARPSITTVLLSGRGGTAIAGDAVDGARRFLQALPRSVRRIVVLRDTPVAPATTPACVRRAVAGGAPPGAACGRPRAAAVPRDPLAVAARDVGRARVVDLTHLLCGPSQCPAVIGGALVLRDTTHLTTAFAASLGPFLHRALGAPARR